MEPYILEIENLTAAFGSREVLSGIGCKIRRGRKTAVVGESGSGKTVFAQSIMRLNPDLALKGRLISTAKMFCRPHRAVCGSCAAAKSAWCSKSR